MGRIDPRIFTANPPHDGTNFLAGIIFTLVGLFFFGMALVGVVQAPWDIAETGVEIEGTRAEGHRVRGDHYVIEVDGERWVCARGHQRFAAETAAILYDPADPSRCRARDSMDGPSRFESVHLCFGATFLLGGAAMLFAWFAEPRPEWQRENPSTLLRPRLMPIARVLLAGSTLSILATLYFSLLTYDRPPDRGLRRSEPAPQAETPSVVAGESSTPLEPKPLTVVEGDDWPVAKPRLRALDVRGPSVWIGDPEPIGTRLVVSTGKSYFSRGDKHHLVDVATGRTLASFDDEGLASATAKVVVTRVAGEPVVVNADDGLVVAPEITLASGRSVEKIRIVASETDARVWLFARADDGIVFHGQWTDTRVAAVALKDTLSVWPHYATGKHGIEVWDTRSDLAPDVCARYRFNDGSTPRCLEHGSSAELMPTPLGPFLGGPWKKRSMFDATLVNTDTGQEHVPLPDCGAVEVTRLDVPPRLLAVCADPTQTTRLYGLWAPEGTRTFEIDQPPGTINSGVRKQPVASIERIADDGTPLVHWLDMERAELWTSPPVFTPVYGGSFGFARRILAHRVEAPEGLWVIDLDAGTMQRIASDIGCEGALVETDLVGERVVVGCSKVGAATSDASRLRSFRWTEVIDFAARKRWRTEGAFDGRIAADGTAIGVTRKRPAQAMALETR
jgi:hypothetical protein